MATAETEVKAPARARTRKPKADPRAESLARAQRAAMRLKQASDATRVQVILMLAAGERNVGSMCEQLGQSQPAVSHHIALMRHGGFIEPRRDGKHNFYRLTHSGRTLADVIRAVLDD